MIKILKNSLLIELSEPEETYRGTRFDHSGVFHRIEYAGYSFADKWYDLHEDPLRHDNVRGTSEEFLGVIPTAEGWLKIGVGTLADDIGDGNYDWFHTYPVVKSESRNVKVSGEEVLFLDEMPGFYHRQKLIRIDGDGIFSIHHRILNLWDRPLDILNYNHNFFTLGLSGVGKGRRITLPGEFTGTWREDSLKAEKKGNSILTVADILEGEKSCMLDIHGPYSFTLEGENGLTVEASSDAPLHHAQYWANHKVACFEPFISASVEPGASCEWTIQYKLKVRKTFSE